MIGGARGTAYPPTSELRPPRRTWFPPRPICSTRSIKQASWDPGPAGRVGIVDWCRRSTSAAATASRCCTLGPPGSANASTASARTSQARPDAARVSMRCRRGQREPRCDGSRPHRERPAPDPGADVAERTLDRRAEHERQDHRTHRRVERAAEEAREPSGEADEDHDPRGDPRVRRQRGPDRDGTTPMSVSTVAIHTAGAPPKSANPRNTKAPNAPKSAAWLLPTTWSRSTRTSAAPRSRPATFLEHEVPRIVGPPHPRSEIVQPPAQVPAETLDDGSERVDLVVADHDVAHTPSFAALDECVADLVDGAEQCDA